ncbi:TerD family protein [Actinacidiphila cocklensis]|uniref:TerD domain-containing protein n=1 Tax=Actinacidiphila cocklensis TaxID=887465 RepID=A0A9W4DLL3_9ACTN|nr:hypothetical protein SCOCK_140091 [Actinacidiphila cocklensis]
MVVRHTLRIPASGGSTPIGNAWPLVRQLDAALLSAGFTLSAEARRYLAGLPDPLATCAGVRTIDAVRELAGAHVRHNAYFVDFPANVPDTLEFWWSCVAGALADEATRAATREQLSAGVVDLLPLPAYGRYQHTYAEMLAAHGQLVAAAGDRVTVLHLGGPLEEEVRALYLALAGSSTPLGDEGLRVGRPVRRALLAGRDAVVAAASQAVAGASGRVLLAVREHFLGRGRPSSDTRVFVNRRGAGWATGDNRRPLPVPELERVTDALDAEIVRRLPRPEQLLIDPDMLDVALPLSGRATTSGFGVLPRGSQSPVDGDLLRFFVYWKQAQERTDFDLSAQLLDADYRTVAWLSYTQLTQYEGEHSGDITEAPDGASEFINLRLAAVRAAFIVPQVHIYSGEGFDEVEESFFGFMLRDREQQGQPFEARTVRMKSELRGPGRASLPLAFVRGRDGEWRAKWLHLYLRGMPAGNRVEEHKITAAELLRSVVEREYLTVRRLTDLMAAQPGTVSTRWDGTTLPAGPVTYIGMERPEGLHPDSVVITPQNLRALIPE